VCQSAWLVQATLRLLSRREHGAIAASGTTLNACHAALHTTLCKCIVVIAGPQMEAFTRVRAFFENFHSGGYCACE
jgi:hypothetical protein